MLAIHSIETGNLMLDGGAMYGVVPKVLWQKKYPANEKNLCNLSMRSLLIITNDKKILIDTGIGNKQDEKFFGYYFLNGDATLKKSLKKHGCSFDDITDVILTHLHFDHCGGAVKIQNNQFVPTFQNANYHISKSHWKWASDPNCRERASFFSENFMAIKEAGQLNLIEKEGMLFENIEIRIFNGHTEGQIVPIIHYNNQKIVCIADVVPTVSHIPINYVAAYDIRPLLSFEEKEAFLNEAIKNNYILFFEHDIYNECCNLQKTPKGIREKDTFKLKDLK